MYFVYLLYSQKDYKFYTGYTNDLERRFQEHQNGLNISTKHRRPLELVYYEAYLEKQDAEGREKFLKGGSGKKYLKKQLKIWMEKNIKKEEMGIV
jgi:putative endonuclease